MFLTKCSNPIRQKAGDHCRGWGSHLNNWNWEYNSRRGLGWGWCVWVAGWWVVPAPPTGNGCIKLPVYWQV